MSRRPAPSAPSVRRAVSLAAAAAMSAAAPALAIDRYWVAPIIGQWADSTNWSSLPGGGGLTGIPLFGDSAWILTEFASDGTIVVFSADSTPSLADVTLGGPGSPLLTMGGGTLNHQVTRIGREGNGRVTVGGTAVLNATTQLALGIFGGDHGELSLTSEGLAQSPLVAIGISGDGELTQDGDGLLDAGEVIMARNAGSTATWSIDVAEDAAFVTSDVEVGRDGDAVLDVASGLLEVGGTITFGSASGTGAGTWSGGVIDAGAIAVDATSAAGLVVDGAEVTTDALVFDLNGDVAVMTVASGFVQANTLSTGFNQGVLRVHGGVLTTGTTSVHGRVELAGAGTLRAATSMTIDASALHPFLMDDQARLLTPSLSMPDGELVLSGGTIAAAYLPPPLDTYLLGDFETDGTLVFAGGDLLMNVTTSGFVEFADGLTDVAIGGRLVLADGFIQIREGLTLSVGRDAALQGAHLAASLIVQGTFDSLERITTSDGGQIVGSGTVLGGLDMATRIVPASQLVVGRIRIGGGLTMLPEGQILIDIQDPDAGVNDVVEMLDPSPIHLAGELGFRVMDGWTPADGDAVTAIEWPAGTPVTGDFDTFDTFDAEIFPAGLTPVGEVTATGYVLRFERACVGDVDLDGEVGFGDIVSVLAAWGACSGGCPADLDGNGVVEFADLIGVLAGFGSCG